MTDRVLVIDDSVPLHKLIRSQLKNVPIELHSAYDGESGISMAASLRPSLILLDVDMSNMDGLTVCRRLKADVRAAAIPVIFLTADPEIKDKIAALELGTIDHITKPFQSEELSARVHAVLRAKHAFEQKAMIDGLTGLGNSRYLEVCLAGEIAQARHHGGAIACIVCEIDGLRRIKSKCGIPFGDETIRSVGNILSNCGRADNLVCHLGAGRFSVLVPSVDRGRAGRIAQLHCDVIQGTLATLLGVDVEVRCSFGVADTFVAGESLLLERATAALHRAQLNGGCCVCIARPHRSARKTAA
jgi:diguanylate cyclase (GGDEF)-like protein